LTEIIDCYRYLYYTDWGKTASVVRTRLDGSSPKVIKVDLNNPNGIAVIGNKLYVTDSNYKTRVPENARDGKDGSLYSMNAADGSEFTDVLETSSTKLKVYSGRRLYFFIRYYLCLAFLAKIWLFLFSPNHHHHQRHHHQNLLWRRSAGAQ